MTDHPSQPPSSDEDFPLSPEFKIPEESDAVNARADDAMGSIPGVFDSHADLSAVDFPSMAGINTQSLAGTPPVEEHSSEPPSPSEPSSEPPPASALEAPELHPDDALALGTFGAPPVESTGAEMLARVREFSEGAGLAHSAVPASYPFSLLIEGPLNVHEREKLLDVLSRENMGIREVDLEPQFESGRVLIPRISEFAGVLLVQALRGTSAQMRLGPSDSIFATDDTRSEPFGNAKQLTVHHCSHDEDHPAEALPMTTESALPELPHAVVIDIVMASAALHSNLVQAEHSSAYQELLEALNRELKYKAYRKGAQAILNYNWQLMPLSLPTHYRLTVSGTAVRKSPPAGSTPN